MSAAWIAGIKELGSNKPFNRQGERMIRQTVLGFKIERTEERLTAHGGLALMAEFNHGIGLRELTNRYLPGPGSNRGYEASVFVDTLVMMLQAGGRRLEDLREIRRESGLMAVVGEKRIPDADTVGDWLRRMGDPKGAAAGLMGLGEVRDRINERIIRRDRTVAYTLDVDATQIEAEKQEAVYTYQGVKGYMPMLGFLYETPLCLFDEFREGNQSPSAGHVAFYQECKRRIPQGKRIGQYRADSASYQADLINVLEEDGVIWAITADQDAAVKRLIEQIGPLEWKPIAGSDEEVAETVHTMNKTKKAFRLILKRWVKKQNDLFKGPGEAYGYHGVASNWRSEEKSAAEVLSWHNQRGEAENFNKELKSGCGMEQMPCRETHANAVFFRIGVLAYNLFIGFKRLTCPARWVHHTLATIRWKFIQIAGRIIHHAGRFFIKLMVDQEMLESFHEIRSRCFEVTAVT